MKKNLNGRGRCGRCSSYGPVCLDQFYSHNCLELTFQFIFLYLSQVESQWEDCSYRIDSLNLIQFIHKSLKSGLDSVKTQMNVEIYNENALRDQLKELLDSFSENIYHALPDLPKQGFTRLDKLTRDHRAQTLSSIRKDCDSIRKRISVSLKNGDDFSVIEVIEELEQYIAQLKSLAYEVRPVT